MYIDIRYRPAHTLAVVTLEPGESIRAESGAMVSMSAGIEVQTQGPSAQKKGGLFKGLKRAFLGGESFFTNLYTSRSPQSEVTFAPRLCGDITVHQVQPGETLFIQGTSYLAAPDSVQIDTKWQGLKSLVSSESMFFLAASGQGPALINAFGAIQALDFSGELMVDTGHLVAFTQGIRYELAKASQQGWIASWLSGEGLVLKLSGQGKLYLQTRNPGEYGSAIGRMLPAREG